jgi:hypothetical protein
MLKPVTHSRVDLDIAFSVPRAAVAAVRTTDERADENGTQVRVYEIEFAHDLLNDLLPELVALVGRRAERMRAPAPASSRVGNSYCDDAYNACVAGCDDPVCECYCRNAFNLCKRNGHPIMRCE